MRLGFYNAHPGVENAEKEFLSRAMIAVRRLGWEVEEFSNPIDAENWRADVLLITHNQQPKLSSIPSIGLMWNPTEFFRDWPQQVHNILSYNGYLPGSEPIRLYIEDLLYSRARRTPIAPFEFYPSCYATKWSEKIPRKRKLFYAGMGWDGNRHNGLIEKIAKRLPLNLYGPPKRWKHLKHCYQGFVPFDGISMLDRIQESGITLCFHRQEHRKENVPSMRLFEAAAAQSVIIADEIPFAKQHFRDSIFTVNFSQPTDQVVQELETIYNWIESHPEDATEMAKRSHEIFCESLCLEKLLAPLPEYLQAIQSPREFKSLPQEDSTITAILSIQEWNESVLLTLTSLQKQTHSSINLQLVGPSPLEKVEEPFRSIIVSLHASYTVGFENQQQSWWDQLTNIGTPYFTVLQPGLEYHPNCFSSLLAQIQTDRSSEVVCTGLIDRSNNQPSEKGMIKFPSIQAELSNLFHDGENLTPMPWLAKSSLLTEELLKSPRLSYCELEYLLASLLIIGQSSFHWVALATLKAVTTDNSLNARFIDKDLQRIRDRLTTHYQNSTLFSTTWTSQKSGSQTWHISGGSEVYQRRIALLRESGNGLKKCLFQWKFLPRRLAKSVQTTYRFGWKELFRQAAQLGRSS
ncbi:Hypothetical protein PBC10988_39450 [Planctomycetales bacterium 10988]|nr:Hypothetical protein PBC10988_39450 [Planctomycetales bacterium 10988]